MATSIFSDAAGGVAGVFQDLTALQANPIPNGRKVELITGEKFQVEALDGGNGVALAGGNFANPSYFGTTALVIDEVAPDNSLEIIASGDVGVGTSSPNTTLDTRGVTLSGSVTATSGNLQFGGFYVTNNILNTYGSQMATGFTDIGYAVKPKNGTPGYVSSAGNTSLKRGVISLGESVEFLNNNSAATVAIDGDVTMTSRLKITGSGDVGINNILPNAKLDVRGVTLSGAEQATNGGLQFGGFYILDNIINTYGAQRTSAYTDIGYAVKPKNGSAGYVSSIDNVSIKRGVISIGERFEFLNNASFTTVPIDTDITMTSRFIVTESGDAGIGTPTPRASLDIDKNTDALSLVVDRPTATITSPIAEFKSDVTSANTTHCRILADGDLENTNNSYGAISDLKLKENILDCTSKLADVMAIRVCNFNLKNDPNKQIGVIAQEIEQIFPSIIKNSDDYEMVLDPDWSPKPERIEERQMSVETTNIVLKNVIVLENGKYVEKAIDESVIEKTLLWDEFPLYDEDGIEIENKVHKIPRMETITIPGETESNRPFISQKTGTITKSVKYSVLLPILIKAVQELKAQVDALTV